MLAKIICLFVAMLMMGLMEYKDTEPRLSFEQIMEAIKREEEEKRGGNKL